MTPLRASDPDLFGDTLLHKRAHRSIATWLAYLALGLIMFAPTVSRTLAFATAGSGMGMDCSMHAAAHPHGPSPDAPHTPDVCGYCTLMCHSPALATGLVLVVFPPPAAPFAIRDPQRDAPLPALLERRSRGPPLA